MLLLDSLSVSYTSFLVSINVFFVFVFDGLIYVCVFVDGLWPDYNDGTWPACCTHAAFNEKEVPLTCIFKF